MFEKIEPIKPIYPPKFPEQRKPTKEELKKKEERKRKTGKEEKNKEEEKEKEKALAAKEKERQSQAEIIKKQLGIGKNIDKMA